MQTGRFLSANVEITVYCRLAGKRFSDIDLPAGYAMQSSEAERMCWHMLHML